MNETDVIVCRHLSIFVVYTGLSSTTDMASDISTCVVNAILAVLSSIGNACVILAYHGNLALQNKSNLLIVALAFTDLLVGVLVQPLFIWVKIKHMTGSIDCFLEIVSDLSTKFSFSVSLLTLGLVVTAERYIAVFHPLKHHAWLTKKKLFHAIIFIWIGTGLVIVIIPFGVPRVVYQSFGLLLIVLTLTSSSVLYIKIARKLRMKSRVTSARPSTRVKRVSWALNPSQVRAAVTMFYVLGSLFICWLPMLSGFVYVSIKGQDLKYQKFLWTWGVTCIFLNSFCNPFIYSWRNRGMSYAIRTLFISDRNAFVPPEVVSTGRKSYSVT